jgi:hypothetical protein
VRWPQKAPVILSVYVWRAVGLGSTGVEGSSADFIPQARQAASRQPRQAATPEVDVNWREEAPVKDCFGSLVREFGGWVGRIRSSDTVRTQADQNATDFTPEARPPKG